jgi:hypothetical protein
VAAPERGIPDSLVVVHGVAGLMTVVLVVIAVVVVD